MIGSNKERQQEKKIGRKYAKHTRGERGWIKQKK
jgi:hypothetical protein